MEENTRVVQALLPGMFLNHDKRSHHPADFAVKPVAVLFIADPWERTGDKTDGGVHRRWHASHAGQGRATLHLHEVR